MKYSPTGVPHDRVSEEGPEHPAPHSLPAIQDRVRDCVPDPHCTEHALQAPYAPHRESTKISGGLYSFCERKIFSRAFYNFPDNSLNEIFNAQGKDRANL